MNDGTRPRNKATNHPRSHKIGAATPVPLCRYEELALRENHLRHAASRLNEK